MPLTRLAAGRGVGGLAGRVLKVRVITREGESRWPTRGPIVHDRGARGRRERAGKSEKRETDIADTLSRIEQKKAMDLPPLPPHLTLRTLEAADFDKGVVVEVWGDA